MNKAIFLDRDGTLIFDNAYHPDPNNVVYKPGVLRGLRILQTQHKLIVVTNQGGPITKGTSSLSLVNIVHRKMVHIAQRFPLGEVQFDGFYVCSHYPPQKCECRKPKPGLILKAAKEHEINLISSVMIGDFATDIMAGKSAGCGLNILVESDPKQKEELEKNHIVSDFISPDFLEIVRFIVEKNGQF